MRKVLLLIAISVFSLSCGYSTRSTLPSNYRTIYVNPFKNNILYDKEGSRNLYLPLLEQKVRNAIINRFLFDGALKIAKSEQADLILKGELINYERGGLRFTDEDNVQEYRITITVSLELWDPVKQEVVWSESSFSGEATYIVSGAQAKSEDTAVAEAITDLARRVVERTVEDW